MYTEANNKTFLLAELQLKEMHLLSNGNHTTEVLALQVLKHKSVC